MDLGTLALHIAAALAAFFQSVTGIGFGMIAGPVILMVLNDPAAYSNETVQRTYDRAQFESLWLKHTRGTAYLIYPEGTPVPDL